MMFTLREIVPTIDVNSCNLNCQIELYSKLAAILVKNIESFVKLPGKYLIIVCSEFEYQRCTFSIF